MARRAALPAAVVARRQFSSRCGHRPQRNSTETANVYLWLENIEATLIILHSSLTRPTVGAKGATDTRSFATPSVQDYYLGEIGRSSFTTLNFADFSAAYPTPMSGVVADPLDPDKSAFMELQGQAAPAPHQPYPLRAPGYQPPGAQGHDGPPGFQTQGPPRAPLGAYPFPGINNGPLHNSYGGHPTHPYLSSYPGGPCGPCPSPPRDGE
ncbi:hypothetical protein HPB51_006725 [Rhipicephalus microplus]|uniref:Uncharacterized protein n=1 Tax=Rhipicephalus microplus TaxID=6941 RepID=A0A9J6E821_RHIMP|nr:hypothetical protein HPB51_006725 [Rhipicephalus microplus]